VAKENGWVPVRRGVLEHIPKMNDRGKRGSPPSPYELYLTLVLLADHKTGIVHETRMGLARRFGCSLDGVKRALTILLQQKYLVRIYDENHKPLLFIRKYQRWHGRKIEVATLRIYPSGNFKVNWEPL
jgi:hypothetical protein